MESSLLELCLTAAIFRICCDVIVRFFKLQERERKRGCDKCLMMRWMDAERSAWMDTFKYPWTVATVCLLQHNINALVRIRIFRDEAFFTFSLSPVCPAPSLSTGSFSGCPYYVRLAPISKLKTVLTFEHPLASNQRKRTMRRLFEDADIGMWITSRCIIEFPSKAKQSIRLSRTLLWCHCIHTE
jgi:hypothetical protein